MNTFLFKQQLLIVFMRKTAQPVTRVFTSPTYVGKYKISGSTGTLHLDANDNLDKWLAENCLCRARDPVNREEGYLFIEHAGHFAHLSGVIDQSPSNPMDGEKVEYRRSLEVRTQGNTEYEFEIGQDITKAALTERGYSIYPSVGKDC